MVRRPFWQRYMRFFGVDVRREVDEELRFHLEQKTRDLIDAGLAPPAAAAEARRQFGEVGEMQRLCESIGEAHARAVGRRDYMSGWTQDLRYGVRMLAKAPLVTVVAVVSMALGIGANTAIFTLLDQVILRSLPVTAPDRLVRVRTTGFFYGSTNGTGAELPHPLWLDLREQSHVFSGVFGVSKFSAAVNDGDGTSVAHGELVTGTYFPVLGVGTARGRLLGREDDRAAGAHPVAVVSHAYWQRVLGADPQVVGRTLRIAGTPLTIVGVTAPGFDGASVDTAAQIFVPMAMRGAVTRSSDQLTDRRARWLNVFARLQPGVTAEQATSALQPWYRAVRQQELLESGFARASSQVRQRFLDENRLQVLPAPEGHTPARDELRRPLWILMGVVGGVLLIACANLANLLLARGAVRQREIALRLSLGATRARVIRQLLVETLLLALLGGAAGLVVAWGGAHLLLQFFVNADGPTLIHATPDVRILAFTLLMSVGTGVLFGMAPALQATNPALAPTLKSEAGSVLGGSRQGLRRALVVSQVALSLVLLTGAGLFLRSLDGLLSMNLGFSPERLLMFGADAAQAGYDSVRTKQFATELLDRVRATPGVEAAGFSSVPLLWDAWWGNSITIEGYVPADGEDPGSRCNAVSPGYFAALGIDLLSGRDFTDGDFRVPPSDMSGRDASGGYRVAIASESFVRRYITGNPIGRHIGLGNDPGTATPIEIIGVVKDSTYSGPREERQHQLYFPYLEGIEAGMPWFYVRAQRDPALLLPAMRQVVRGLNADVPVHALRTLDEQLARSVINQRLITTLSGVFGALATLLAMVGLYGVVAYTVTRRTREIGVRMALGGQRGPMAWLILRGALLLVVGGIALAVPAIWGLGGYLQGELHGVAATDPVVATAATAILVVVATAAALLPAMRAARINPMRALRQD